MRKTNTIIANDFKYIGRGKIILESLLNLVKLYIVHTTRNN